MKPLPNISVIIPNLNGQDFLVDCLKSLHLSLNTAKIINYEIILVDNASTDNSIKIFNQFCQDLKIKHTTLRLNTNCGFAKAVNLGILESKNDWVLLTNNDVTVDPSWFTLLNNNISNNNDIAAYCGTVLNRDGTKVESQGLQFFFRGKCQNINNGQKFQKILISKLIPKPIWGASAALVAYRRKIINKIGLFDENFFAYEEDVDLSFRLHRLGYKTIYIPTAYSYHLGGGTSSKMGNLRQRMDVKNWILLIIKNYSLKEIYSNLFPIIEERLRNLSGLIKNTALFQLIPSILFVYIQIIFFLPQTLKRRQEFFKMLKLVQPNK